MEKTIEWKPVVGYEGKYEVSNSGLVASLNYGRTGERKIMKPQIDRYGYMYISMASDKKLKVHQMVAKAFIPNPESKPTVNHLDENKLNNCAGNLEWATFSEQNKYSKGKKVEIIDGDKVYSFNSIREAANYFGLDRKKLGIYFKENSTVYILKQAA